METISSSYEKESDSEIFTIQSIRISQYKNIHNEAFALFCRKNHDYGDAFATFGPLGVMVRMQDKLMRFINLQKDFQHNHSLSLSNMVQDESIQDTLLDLHNYAAMALMLMRES